MKEDILFNFAGIILFLNSISPIFIYLKDYVMVFCALPFLLYPFIKFRYSLSVPMSYGLYAILLIPVLIKYFISYNGSLPISSAMLLPIYYLIFLSAATLYRVKNRNHILFIYFSSVMILIFAGYLVQDFYFQVFVIIHLLFLPFFLRSLLSFYYKSIKLSCGLRQYGMIFATIFITFIISLSFNQMLKWMEVKVNYMMYPMESNLEYSGLFDETSLNVTGKIKVSTKVVLRVKTSSPVERLRCKVYTGYSKGKWKTGPVKNPVPRIVPEDIKPLFPDYNEAFKYIFFNNYGLKAPVNICNVNIASDLNTVFFTTPETFIIATDTSAVSMDQYGIFYPQESMKGMDYAIMEYDGPEYVMCPELKDNNLLVIPENISPQIISLSKNLTSRYKNIYDKCDNVKRFFHNEFQYSLDFNPSNPDEPLEEFLFRKKSAHCEYFATGMIILLRASGIPARYVTGFLVHEYNRTAGYYIVRERDAHAWVEAFVPDKGWVTFDPTPSSNSFEELLGPDETGFLGQILDLLAFKWEQLINLFVSGKIWDIIKVLWNKFLNFLSHFSCVYYFVIAVASFLLFLFLRKNIYFFNIFKKIKKIEREKSEEDKVFHAILNDFDSIMKKNGFERKEHLTLYEYGDYLKEKSLTGQKLNLCHDFLDEYCRLRYSGNNNKELGLLKHALSEINEVFKK